VAFLIGNKNRSGALKCGFSQKKKIDFFSDIDTRTCIYTHPYKRMSTQLTPKRRDWSPIDEVNNAIILEI